MKKNRKNRIITFIILTINVLIIVFIQQYYEKKYYENCKEDIKKQKILHNEEGESTTSVFRKKLLNYDYYDSLRISSFSKKNDISYSELRATFFFGFYTQDFLFNSQSMLHNAGSHVALVDVVGNESRYPGLCSESGKNLYLYYLSLLKKYDRYGGRVYKMENKNGLNVKELKSPRYYLNRYHYSLDSLLESTYDYYSVFYEEKNELYK